MLRIILPLLLTCCTWGADYPAQYEITRQQRVALHAVAAASTEADTVHLTILLSAIFDGTMLLYVLDANHLTVNGAYGELIADVSGRRRASLRLTSDLIDHMRASASYRAVDTDLLFIKDGCNALLATDQPPASSSSAP